MPPPFDTSPALAALPGLRHGFFGRQGGASAGDFASLNVSEASGDDLTLVAQNRAEVTAAIGFPAAALVTVKQVHSADAVTLAAPPGAGDRPAADALVTDRPGLLLGILTADCTPVLLADPEAGVVGALHAGWKGALDGIAETTVARMAALGARPARIIAAIGPTISQANYEVGPDFAANLLARHPDAAARLATPAGGREHFDLPGFVADRLLRAGIGTIEDLKLCTYAAPERYFSHRYATHRATGAGRQIAVIGLA